ncbi:hypothetical protein G7Y31_02965 [Corynebacterium lizhenjunii]|uniref:Uncharacterized protein n=1 Tax=Corynebacterium lizhenjunii TaxID=2709394 RepID=A0A7T0KHA5_9CORY|nr:hypothetical protein [Corynebacterium lizhenjunii]QPK79683.1 hypothetical protein G7Y31_02965 [Corynebacterium lizhenjunii]
MSTDSEPDYWSGQQHYDAEMVRFFDVAHEGAQVRAVAAAVPALEAALYGSTPRAIVVLPTDHVARVCAQFVARTFAAVPLVVADELPTFVGALDVVVVLGERAECDQTSQALLTAARRGAQCVAVVPGVGPLLADATSCATIIGALPTATAGSPARYISALEAICSAASQPAAVTQAYLAGLASELDAEVEALGPDRDVSVNPARQLRDFAEDCLVFHTGAPLAEVAAALFARAGLGAGVVEPEDVPQIRARYPQAQPDPFYDPFLDGPGSGPDADFGWTVFRASPKVIVWAGAVAQEQAPGDDGQTLILSAASDTAHPLQLITRAFAAAALDASPDTAPDAA